MKQKGSANIDEKYPGTATTAQCFEEPLEGLQPQFHPHREDRGNDQANQFLRFQYTACTFSQLKVIFSQNTQGENSLKKDEDLTYSTTH